MTTTNNKHSAGGPVLAPPAGATAGTAGVTAPEVTEEQLASLVQSMESAAVPTMKPPTAGELATAEGVGAAWHTSKRIDALWSIDQARNAWIHVVDLGWRRLYNGRDGAFQALTTLASQARQTNSIVHLREEPDGMIYEIYLW